MDPTKQPTPSPSPDDMEVMPGPVSPPMGAPRSCYTPPNEDGQCLEEDWEHTEVPVPSATAEVECWASDRTAPCLPADWERHEAWPTPSASVATPVMLPDTAAEAQSGLPLDGIALTLVLAITLLVQRTKEARR